MVASGEDVSVQVRRAEGVAGVVVCEEEALIGQEDGDGFERVWHGGCEGPDFGSREVAPFHLLVAHAVQKVLLADLPVVVDAVRQEVLLLAPVGVDREAGFGVTESVDGGTVDLLKASKYFLGCECRAIELYFFFIWSDSFENRFCLDPGRIRQRFEISLFLCCIIHFRPLFLLF